MADMVGTRMTLVSDPTPEFPNNTNAAFQVRLLDPLRLPGDNWEAALVSISTPNKGLTAATFGMQDDDYLLDIRFHVYNETDSAPTYHSRWLTAGTLFNIPGGIRDGEHLATLMTTWIENAMRSLGQGVSNDKGGDETRMYRDHNVTPTVRRIGHDVQWELRFFQHDQTTSKCVVLINQAFGRALGWFADDGSLGVNALPAREDDRLGTRGYWKSVAANVASLKDDNNVPVTHLPTIKTPPYTPPATAHPNTLIQLSRNYTWIFRNVNAAFHAATTVAKRSMLVYTDLIVTSVMGHQKHELLRELFLQHDQHDTRQLSEPVHYQWIPVRSRLIETVTIQLGDLDGRLLALPAGKTLVTIALRPMRRA